MTDLNREASAGSDLNDRKVSTDDRKVSTDDRKLVPGEVPKKEYSTPVVQSTDNLPPQCSF